MGELLAYVYMIKAGFEAWELYENRLNELFLADPENPDLLELEMLSGKLYETEIYLKKRFDICCREAFGRALIKGLRVFYVSMSIQKFCDRLYDLWEELYFLCEDFGEDYREGEPFRSMVFAGDPLDCDDEERSRKICMEMLNFYDE